MRSWVLVCACLTAVLPAQERKAEYQAYSYDAGGNRLGSRSYAELQRLGQIMRKETVDTLNGRAAPLEQVEEKILEDGPGGRVIERTVQRYSLDGRPGTPEKIRIEERPGPSGGLTVTTTRYEGDLNGRLQMYERATTRSTSSGDTTDAVTEVERPTISGSLEVVERKVQREVVRGSRSTSDLTVYRRNGGQFAPAARETTDVVRTDGTETSTSVRYNTVNASGAMTFAGQTVINVERRPDGSEHRIISEYGGAEPGRSIDSGGRTGAQLREQIIVEREVRPDSTVVERTGVRRVSLSDPTKLEPYQPVSEVVCRGACLPPPPAEKRDEQKTDSGT